MMQGLDKGKKVKIQVKCTSGHGARKKRIVSGIVIEKSEKFAVIQTKNYKECINFSDLIIGAAVVMEAKSYEKRQA